MKSHDVPSENDGLSRPEMNYKRIHVIPIGDLYLHSAQDFCWCHPTETENNVLVHNAKDCREARERIREEKCSDGWINIAEFNEPFELAP